MTQKYASVDIKDRLLAAFDSTQPEDRARLEKTFSLLDEVILGSRSLFFRYLASMPAETLKQAWSQTDTWRFPVVMEQVLLDFSRVSPESKPALFQPAENPGEYQVTRPVTAEQLLAFTRSLLEAQFRRADLLSDPDATKDFLMAQLATRPYEVFSGVFLDNKHRVLAFEELFRGTIDGCSVHPREVLQRALHHNAAALIFAHNHPSGEPEPSQADQQITRRLKQALSMVGIRVLDHIIVGGAQTVSFVERGLL